MDENYIKKYNIIVFQEPAATKYTKIILTNKVYYRIYDNGKTTIYLYKNYILAE